MGLFWNLGCEHKRIAIVPMYLREHLLQGIPRVFIEESDCPILYPDAVYDLSPPPGWNNAEQISVY